MPLASLRRWMLLVACVACVACADAPTTPPDPPSAADRLRLNEAWLVGTHNAHWVDRGVASDLFSSGVQQSLLDQLVADHARALELDVHPDPERPGRYRVFHTVPGNSLCDDLVDCLEPLRLFHVALPRHEPVHVIVELKKFTGPSFDATHTVDDLEAIFEQALGDWLFRPRDLLERCGATDEPDPDLVACAARAGWPTIAELRGRFLVSVLGNFDDLLPQAKGTLDWAHFTLHGDLRTRTAFAMASSWKTDWDALPEKIRAELSRDDLARALRRTVFLQVEDTADPNLAPFLAANGMVRIGGAYTIEDQVERIALGAQILQGDSPWLQHDDRGPAQPLRAFDSAAGVIVEPGDHLVLDATSASAPAMLLREVPRSAVARWSTLPAVGGASTAVPCLVATVDADDADRTSFAVCRDKRHAPRIAGAPLGSGHPDAEKLRVVLRVCRGGACEEIAPALAGRVEIGVALGLEVAPDEGGSCARALIAAEVGDDGQPRWHALGERHCFAEPLRGQGLLARAGASAAESADVVFAGTTLLLDGRSVDLAPAGAR